MKFKDGNPQVKGSSSSNSNKLQVLGSPNPPPFY